MTRFRKIINKYLNSSCLWLMVIALVLFLFIWRFAYPNYLILGGEGNYFLNLPETKNFGYTWSSGNNGTGGFTRLIHSQFLIINVLACLQTVNLWLASLLNAFAVYYLPFFFIFILLKKCLKLSLFGSLIFALFYILNLFSSYYLTKLFFWETAILFILPVFFIIIYRNFYRPSRLFIYFGMTSFFLSSGFANLPLLGVALLSVPLFLIINSLIIEDKLDLKRCFISLVLLAVSFFLFNFWWIIHFISRRKDLLAFYPKGEAISWASRHLPQNIVSDIFSLRWLFSLNERNYNFYSNFYTSPLIVVFLFIPLIFLFYYFCRLRQKSQTLTVALLFLLVCLFLSAGVAGPFGVLYLLFLKVIPFFIIFKTPWEKFGPLLIFWITISFGLLFNFLNDKQKKYFYSFIILYLIICSISFLTNNFIPESKIHEGKYSSRRFIFKQEYQEMIKAVNEEKNLFRVMSLPGSLNYQVTMQNHDNKYYRGMDPLMYGLNKPFISAGYNFANFFLFTIISDPNWIKVLSLYNIGEISLNKDIFPSFGFLEKESFEDLEKIFVQNFECSKNSSILLCDNNSFLPRFYIPRKTIYASGGIDNILEVVKFGDWETRSGIFFKDNQLVEDTGALERADTVLIKADLKNTISQDELGSAVFGREELPSVAWQPNNLFYPLILKREEYDKWQVRNDPKKLLEKYFFYSSKRIAETVKFANMMGDQQIKQMAEQYQKEMIKALEVLGQLKTRDEKDFIKLWTVCKRTLRTHQEKIKEIAQLENWDIMFGELEKKTEELKVKRDFSKLVYEIDVPKSGNYSLQVKDFNSLNISELADYLIATGGEEVKIDGEWLELGKRRFDRGKIKLTIPISGISENLVDENLKIKDYTPDSIYRISFDYRAPKGGGFFIAEGKAGEMAEVRLITTRDEFEHFEMFFKSSSEAQDGSVHLSISIAQEKNLKVERIYQPILMLRLNRNDNDEALIVQSMPKITFVRVNPTKYKVKVENAKEPYTLVFSESFHEEWKAYINKVQSSILRPHSGQEFKVQSDYGETVASYFDGDIKEGTHRDVLLDSNIFETLGKKPIPDEKHLLINGYANSWHITPEDSEGRKDYEIIIEFVPQKLLYFGMGISLLVLTTSIAWLTVMIGRKIKH